MNARLNFKYLDDKLRKPIIEKRSSIDTTWLLDIGDRIDIYTNMAFLDDCILRPTAVMFGTFWGLVSLPYLSNVACHMTAF